MKNPVEIYITKEGVTELHINGNLVKGISGLTLRESNLYHSLQITRSTPKDDTHSVDWDSVSKIVYLELYQDTK